MGPHRWVEKCWIWGTGNMAALKGTSAGQLEIWRFSDHWRMGIQFENSIYPKIRLSDLSNKILSGHVWLTVYLNTFTMHWDIFLGGADWTDWQCCGHRRMLYLAGRICFIIDFLKTSNSICFMGIPWYPRFSPTKGTSGPTHCVSPRDRFLLSLYDLYYLLVWVSDYLIIEYIIDYRDVEDDLRVTHHILHVHNVHSKILWSLRCARQF